MCISCTIEEITGLDLSTDEGHEALEKLGRIPWPEATDAMIQAAALVAALYTTGAGGTGGPLHITTDDFNVEDSSIKFCRDGIDGWPGHDDYDASEREKAKTLSGWILDLIEEMSVVERSVTMALAHGYLAQIHGKVYMPRTEFPIREQVLNDAGNVIGTQWGFRSRAVGAQ